jgi:hypothetical protein
VTSYVGGEELRQWQEEEFQRKLRGEYEAAQRRIGEIVSRLSFGSHTSRLITTTGHRVAGPPSPLVLDPDRQSSKNDTIELLEFVA